MYEIISYFGKDGFALGGLQIEELVEYLGGYKNQHRIDLKCMDFGVGHPVFSY